MDHKYSEAWSKISSAVRAAIQAGNFQWTNGFEKAYYTNCNEDVTVAALTTSPPFAVEPIAPMDEDDPNPHMLLFFSNGHCYEGKLLDETGRVMLLWFHHDNWEKRPLVTLSGRVALKPLSRRAKPSSK